MLRTSAIVLALMVAGPAFAREEVPYKGKGEPGEIIISTKERKLYFVQEGGRAIRYKVAVGRPDKQWIGTVEVDGKHVQPAWSPPEEIKRDNPRLPEVIPGGAPNNPMGMRALTLSGGGQYAIHGTNRPEFDRQVCFLWLHPHAERRHHGPVRPRRCRHTRHRQALSGRFRLRALILGERRSRVSKDGPADAGAFWSILRDAIPNGMAPQDEG